MEYRQYKLNNGLTIAAEINPRAHTAAFGYFVKTGSRDEHPQIEGVSHFLEHMVFKGTPRRTAEEVNLILDELGSNSNARTSEESTIYHAAVLPEYQSDIVEILTDLMRPSLRTDDFEMEKQVIIEEIKMYADQPPYGGYERIMQEYFPNHSLGLSILGTEQSITDLTPQQMMDYFQSRYSPDNIALVAAGNIAFDGLIEQVEKLTFAWQRFDAVRLLQPADSQQGFVCMDQPNSNQQYLLQMLPGPTAHDQDRHAARILCSIVGGDGSSRMFWEFLDSGMAESAALGNYEFQDNGVLMAFISCEPSYAQEILNRMEDLRMKICSNGITEKELELAKRKATAAIVLSSERTENRMYSIGFQWLAGQEFKTTAEMVQKYENVTLDQVNCAVQKYLANPSLTVSVGPSRPSRG